MSRTMSHLSIERRTNRSSFTSIALGRWLDAVAARDARGGVVLADARGLLVAHGAIDVDRAEAVAAIACLDLDRSGEIEVERFEHDGEPLYLCALGAGSTGALAEATAGVRRILDERN